MPTRTGYSFVGWRSRNYLNGYKFLKSDYVENFSYKNDILTITSVTKTTPETISGEEQAFVRIFLDLPQGMYVVKYDEQTYSNNIDYPFVHAFDSSKRPILNIEGSGNLFERYFLLDKNYTNFEFVVYANVQSTFFSGTITYKGLGLYKVSSETEVISFEPYHIWKDTKFTNCSDITLTAEWGNSVGDLSNYSAWIASSDVKAYSCSGNDFTVTSKERISYQAYIQYSIIFPVGIYLFTYDNFYCSGDKPYSDAIIYHTSSSSFETVAHLHPNVQREYFTISSSLTGHVTIYACIDTSSSVSCTVSFKNLRLIKLP